MNLEGRFKIPVTPENAGLVQKQLFKLGCSWGDGSTTTFVTSKICAMIVNRGVLTYTERPQTGSNLSIVHWRSLFSTCNLSKRWKPQ